MSTQQLGSALISSEWISSDWMSKDVLIPIGSSVLAMVGAGLSGLMAARARRHSHNLERQTRQETRTEAAERILAQFRDPLLDTAHTLQGRIYNIVNGNYLTGYLHCGDAEEERYARDYTVFTVAEYLCWVEIVRRELRFMDLGDVTGSKALLGALAHIQFSLQDSATDAPFQIFRGRQRAIAEIMMVSTGTDGSAGPRNEALGYAAFLRRLDQEPEFAAWFRRLRADVDTLANGGPSATLRLIQVQNTLIELIDFLDGDAIRIPRQLRKKLAVPATAQTPTQTPAQTRG